MTCFVLKNVKLGNNWNPVKMPMLNSNDLHLQTPFTLSLHHIRPLDKKSLSWSSTINILFEWIWEFKNSDHGDKSCLTHTNYKSILAIGKEFVWSFSQMKTNDWNMRIWCKYGQCWHWQKIGVFYNSKWRQTDL